MEQELTQEGATKEQPAEGTSKAVSEVASTEEKKTSEARIEDTAEYRSMQSKKDIAEGTLKSVRGEFQELRNEIERQSKEARQKEVDSLADDPDAQSRLRRLHQREDNMKTAETKLAEKAAGLTAKWNDAFDLAKQYGVDVNELIITDSHEVMGKMAKLLAQNKVAEQAKGQVEPLVPSGFKPDSGTSDVGGDDDEAFMKTYSEGKSDDHKRAQKILNKT